MDRFGDMLIGVGIGLALAVAVILLSSAEEPAVEPGPPIGPGPATVHALRVVA